MKPINKLYFLLFTFSIYTLYTPLFGDQSANKDNLKVWHVEINKHKGQNGTEVKNNQPHGSLNTFSIKIRRHSLGEKCSRVLLRRNRVYFPNKYTPHEGHAISGVCNKVLSF